MRDPRHQSDLPANPPPHPDEQGGAPKWLWALPILVSIGAFLWVLLTFVNPDDALTETGQQLVAGTRMIFGTAEAILCYILVSSIDRMMRD